LRNDEVRLALLAIRMPRVAKTTAVNPVVTSFLYPLTTISPHAAGLC
jgi:hypothetical protein